MSSLTNYRPFAHQPLEASSLRAEKVAMVCDHSTYTLSFDAMTVALKFILLSGRSF